MFFDRFKELCEEKGVSVYKACTDIGLNRSAVNKWKQGGEPNGTTAARFAKYFGVSTDYLLGNVSEPFFQLDNERILAEINSYETEKMPTVPGERDVRFVDANHQIIFEKCAQLDPKKRKAILDLLKSIIEDE